MTTIKRRYARPVAPEPVAAAKMIKETGPRQPVRMLDALAEIGDVKVFGVDLEEAKAALRKFMSADRPGTDKPYCTCMAIGGYSYDVQLGVYLHAVPECWKPSRLYFEAAVRAGILK